MKKLANFIIGFVGIFTIFTSFFSVVSAQTDVVCPEGKYCALTTIPGATVAGKEANPTAIIQRVYSISIGIAAILAVIMIIWGGIQYATTEAMSGKSDAKDHIQSAFLGLLILVGSYLILKTINSQLVNINLDLGMSKITGGELATGGGVFNNMLSRLKDNAQQTTNLLASQQQILTAAQQELAAAQSQTPQDPNKIAATQLAVKDAQSGKLLAQLKATSDQAALQITRAIQNGDLTAAKQIASSAAAADQTKINNITDPALKLIAQQTSQLNTEQNIVLVVSTDILSGVTQTGKYPSYGGGSDLQKAKIDLLTQTNQVALELAKTNPDLSAQYRQYVIGQIRNIENQWETKLKKDCSQGYTLGGGCKQ